MTTFKILALLFLLLTLAILVPEEDGLGTQPGKIFLSSMSAKFDGSFTFLTQNTIAPNTVIYFTNAKWNGNYFGLNGTNLKWISPNHVLETGTSITIEQIKSRPLPSQGTAVGSLSILTNGDAIFAYQGFQKMPVRFLSVIASKETAYGTLLNTGLIYGVNVMVKRQEGKSSPRTNSSITSNGVKSKLTLK